MVEPFPVEKPLIIVAFLGRLLWYEIESFIILRVELAETLKVIYSSLPYNLLDTGWFETTSSNLHGFCRKFLESR